MTSKVSVSILRDTGREFERLYESDDDNAARSAAETACAQVDYVRSPQVRKRGPGQYVLRYWGVD